VNSSRNLYLQTGLRCLRTESRAAAAHRETDFREPETKGPQTTSGRASFLTETVNGPMRRLQTAENPECSAETGKIRVAQDCVVGAGRTRTCNHAVMSDTPSSEWQKNQTHTLWSKDGAAACHQRIEHGAPLVCEPVRMAEKPQPRPRRWISNSELFFDSWPRTQPYNSPDRESVHAQRISHGASGTPIATTSSFR
jgi:hypothetical protein